MELFWLALAWLAYAALHSLLASFAVKERIAARWPCLMPGYRLGYNLVAVVTALPLAWLVYATPGDWLWRWTGVWAWLANGLALAAVVVMMRSAGHYDMGEFLGLRQLRDGAAQPDRPGGFSLSPFHRFVRHPWYCCGLVLVWTRDMNPALLLSALAITLYFVVGSRLEEKKLLALHGEMYRRYLARVPGLLPLPWKYLRRAEAAELTGG
jgi:protein-S-isoprenylcysteine O-methyltransferase Ste14